MDAGETDAQDGISGPGLIDILSAGQADAEAANAEDAKTLAGEEDDDIDFLDVNVKKNRSSMSDNKRRRS